MKKSSESLIIYPVCTCDHSFGHICKLQQTRLALIASSKEHGVTLKLHCAGTADSNVTGTSINFYHYRLISPLRSCTVLARSVLP